MAALLDSLARLLDDAGVGAYRPDSPFPDDQVPIALVEPPLHGVEAITLTTYSGDEPDSRNGWEYPRLQVRVRAAGDLEAIELDRLVYDALQAAPGRYPVPLPDSDRVLQDCYALASEAEPMGRDDNRRAEYVRNYQLVVAID